MTRGDLKKKKKNKLNVFLTFFYIVKVGLRKSLFSFEIF